MSFEIEYGLSCINDTGASSVVAGRAIKRLRCDRAPGRRVHYLFERLDIFQALKQLQSC